MKETNNRLKWIIWTIVALFYFYEYLLRISPSVIVNDLMETFKIHASTVGILSAFFFYAYAPMQIPVGLLMDRYGAKLLLSIAAFISGLGAIFFAISPYLWVVQFGRLFIGIGASFSFVGMVFICSHWFPVKKRALLIGLANSIAMLGAMFGTGPLSLMVTSMGWRESMFIFGIIGFVFAFFLYYTMKKETLEKKIGSSYASLKAELSLLCKNPYTWVNALVALLFYTTTSEFGGLWGITFLQKSFGLTKSVAAFAISMIFFGWLIGGPLIGHLSDKFKKRKPMILVNMFLTLGALLPLLYMNSLPLSLIYILLFLVGLFSSAELLNFTLSVEINPQKVKGSSVALTNFIVSLGGAFTQPLIGFLLDLNWKGTLQDSIRVYSIEDYRYSLTILPIFLIVGFCLSFFLKEKRHEDELTVKMPYD